MSCCHLSLCVIWLHLLSGDGFVLLPYQMAVKGKGKQRVLWLDQLFSADTKWDGEQAFFYGAQLTSLLSFQDSCLGHRESVMKSPSP